LKIAKQFDIMEKRIEIYFKISNEEGEKRERDKQKRIDRGTD